MDLGYWLPLFFAGAMGLALLIYVVPVPYLHLTLPTICSV